MHTQILRFCCRLPSSEFDFGRESALRSRARPPAVELEWVSKAGGTGLDRSAEHGSAGSTMGLNCPATPTAAAATKRGLSARRRLAASKFSTSGEQNAVLRAARNRLPVMQYRKKFTE